ncbi:U-box domain-containing protein 3-like isoform X1 [Nymphaea colorata]|nr:U-box domain-containing protein 3-like isoform X1 [Nymphaea colorata]
MGNMTGEALVNSISRYIHLVACQTMMKLDPLQKDYRKIVDILKLLRPVLDEAIESNVHSEELLVEFEELDLVVNEARDVIENWNPKMSKILNVLRSEPLVMKVQKSCLGICCVLNRLLISPAIEHCMQELQCMEQGQASEFIEEALRDQRDNLRPRSDNLMKIVELLGLASNQELFRESVALEKEKEKAELTKERTDIHYLDQIIVLVSHIRDCISLNKSRLTDGRAVPAYFCCPLSMELMIDPVIVASGQTFERAFIQKWLDYGLRTCPKTCQSLAHCDLIPNDTVKGLILNWCEMNNVLFPPSFMSVDHQHSYPYAPSTVLDSPDSKTLPRNRSVRSDEALYTANQYFGSNEVLSDHISISQGVRNMSIQKDGTVSFQNGNSFTERRKGSHGMRCEIPSVVVSESKPSNLSSCDQSSDHSRTDSLSSAISSVEYNHAVGTEDSNEATRFSGKHDSNEASGEITSFRHVSPTWLPGRVHSSGNRAQAGDSTVPRKHASSLPSYRREDASASTTVEHVKKLIEGLHSQSIGSQTAAAEELRLLAKYNMENRIMIAECGAIAPLVSLLYSQDKKTQENAVTALLNLSINDENKCRIAEAGVIEPLIHILKTGNSEAKENSAATLFSLSVMEEYKAKIGRSGAIRPLVELLGKGTLRGKKDAATALFNLSIFHENKARIIQAGAVKFLVELMMDPEAGMIDKAVAVLANLSTTPEGRSTICEEGGIPALVEVVEFGSQRGKENAAAALLQLCINSQSYSSLVLQEGAVPPLVALSQSGTPRAKEKAQQILSHFRNQREGKMGKGKQ